MSRVDFSDCFLETLEAKFKCKKQNNSDIENKSENSSLLTTENDMSIHNEINLNKIIPIGKESSADLNVKFVAPKYKIKNKLPHSEKTLNEHMLDMVSLNDKNASKEMII